MILRTTSSNGEVLRAGSNGSKELTARVVLRFLVVALLSVSVTPFGMSQVRSNNEGTSQQRPPTSLAERIRKVIDRPEFRHSIFGIEFYSLDQGKPVFSINADKLFIPASTTKLVTEGTALELLGPDYRFHTRVCRDGAITGDGTLKGDLVLMASGDPNLSGRVRDGKLDFENLDHSYAGSPYTKAVPGNPLAAISDLARQIAAHHIKQVTGHVRVDISLFPEGERELGTNVVISPIMINDNVIDVTVGPGESEGAPIVFKSAPQTSYAMFVNHAITGKQGSRPSIEFSSDIANNDGTRTVTITGSFPAGQKPILFAYVVPVPSRFAEILLVEALRDQGIEVSIDHEAPPIVKTAPSCAGENIIAELISPPFKEEAKVTLKVSQNLHASATPFILGAVLGKASGRNGFDLEREFLTRAGLDLSGAYQSDGEGGNASFTPEFMVSFLAYMSTQKQYQNFLSALPILGRDGSLWNIQSESKAAGHVFAKTGTSEDKDLLNRRMMLGAKGLAGYMTTAENQHLVFAIYVNHVSVPDEPEAPTTIAGQALGEIAAAAYDSVE